MAGAQSGLPQMSSPNTTQWQDTLAWPSSIANFANLSTWQYLVTFVLGLVIFDQGNLDTESRDSIVAA